MEPVSESLPQHFDYLFVGGGFAGLSTALRVKNAHPDAVVGILESVACGAGASAHNSGIIHSPISYPDDPEAGVFTKAQQLFQARFPEAGRQTEGWIYGSRRSINAKREQLKEIGAVWREVEEFEVARVTELGPALAKKSFLAVPQYIVDPQTLVKDLAMMCLAAGVKVFTRKGVTEVVTEAGEAKGVLLATGDFVGAGALVLTSGAGVHRLLTGAKAEYARKLRTRVQTMVAVSGLAGAVDSRGVRVSLQAADKDGLGMVPAASGMALLGLDDRLPTLAIASGRQLASIEVDREVVRATLDTAYQLFPTLKDRHTRVATWAGVKTDFVDGDPSDETLLIDDNPRPLVIDHSESDGIGSLFTLLLGKMTLLFHASRDMASLLGVDSDLDLPELDLPRTATSDLVIASPLDEVSEA